MPAGLEQATARTCDRSNSTAMPHGAPHNRRRAGRRFRVKSLCVARSVSQLASADCGTARWGMQRTSRMWSPALERPSLRRGPLRVHGLRCHAVRAPGHSRRWSSEPAFSFTGGTGCLTARLATARRVVPRPQRRRATTGLVPSVRRSRRTETTRTRPGGGVRSRCRPPKRSGEVDRIDSPAAPVMRATFPWSLPLPRYCWSSARGRGVIFPRWGKSNTSGPGR